LTTDISKASTEELKATLDYAKQMLLAMKAAESFSVEGFHAYFEGGHGTKLHPEAVLWVENIFSAHEEGKGLAQEAFRGSAKTTVFTKYFVSYYIGHHPEKCNLIVRINDNKANESTEAVAFIIEHTEFWKMCFPHVEPDKQKGWGAEGYEVMRTDILYKKWARKKAGLPPDPSFVGRGWKSGSIIGSRVNGCLVVDDIHNEDNTSSELQLGQVKTFITDTLFPVLMDDAWEIWNYTPWRENDAYQYILSTEQYKHNKSPVIVEDENGELWPEVPGIPLSGKKYRFTWPRDGVHGWDYEKLTKTYRQQGHLGFARMYMLDLSAAEGQTLKKEWLNKYNAEFIKNDWPVYMGIDFASSAEQTLAKSKDLDYFTLAVMNAIPGENRVVLIDGIREHLQMGAATIRTEAIASQYPYLKMIGVEAVGGGKEFYGNLLRQTVLPVYECSPAKVAVGRGKGARFENWMSPYFQFRRAYIADYENSFFNHFRNEWLNFPNAKHDDTLDAVFWAMWVAAIMGDLVMKNTGYTNEITNPMYKAKKKSRNFYATLGAYNVDA